MVLRPARWLIGAAVVAGVAFGTPTASAQRSPSPADAEARTLFVAGQAAVDAGRYAAAIEYFQRAYELSHRPALLFNLASAAEHMRRDREALDAYRGYLDAVPNAPNRVIVEARIRVLELVVAGEPVVPAPDDVANIDAALADDADAGAEDPSTEGSDRALPTALLAGGGALAVSGMLFTVLGARDRSKVENAPDGTPWQDVADANARAARRSIAGASTLGAGAACLITGLALALRHDEVPPPTHGFGMEVASSGVEASLWWNF